MPLSLFHLHGDLKDLQFPRLLAALREEQFTGVFQVATRELSPPEAPLMPGGEPREVTRELHFSNGHIAWAISTAAEESLRAFLVREGTVTEQQWAAAEGQAKDGTLRQALADLGLVGQRELSKVEQSRAEAIVLELFAAPEGEYRVRERQLPPSTPDLKIEVSPLLLRGMVERADRTLIMGEIGSMDAVYAVKRPAREESQPDLPGEFQSVLKHLDGKNTIAQVCSLTSLPDYFVCSIAAALSLIGAVKRVQERSRIWPEEAARSIGEAESVAPQPVSSQISLPPITTEPFRGEGPITTLGATPGELEEEIEEEAAREQLGRSAPTEPAPWQEEEEDSPAMLVAAQDADQPDEEVLAALVLEELAGSPDAAGEPLPSAYDPAAHDEASRPWFLLGGGAAVGFAALFLILMAQRPGDAGELDRPPDAKIAAAEITDSADKAGNADIDAGDAVPESVPASPIPAQAAPYAPPRGIAAPRQTSILNSEPGGGASQKARQSLHSGDYLAAARYFGRAASARSGDYSIQLLTACQDTTVKRAVAASGGSEDIFILSTNLDGRSCYRVFWGSYGTQARAREALRRDVPASLRRDRKQPRIIRLGDL